MQNSRFTDAGQALVSKIQYNGDLRGSISQAVAAIGGFQRLVAPGDRILVKPNFNTADHRPRPEPNLIHRINNQRAAPYAPGSVVPAGIAEPSTPPSEPEQHPSAGWYAAGTQPSRTPVTAATPPLSGRPPSAPSLRSHVTRPQPFERPRQIILEWCAPGGG